jgi:hemerythrin-like domain-containing protein
MMANPTIQLSPGRRGFLQAAASAGSLALVACAASGAMHRGQATTVEKEHEEAEVTPGEDLMQEHGVLERILLIYDEAARRIEQNERLDLTLLTTAAGIVQRFVEGYHEKLEEQFVFPRLQRAGREVDLVAVLQRQHERGRQVTDEIVRKAGAAATPDLAEALRSFARMYRPHAAREDTVLFPAFRDVVGRGGYRELGEQFEEKEHELFGERGFENTVGEIARLETALAIGDLTRFTP